eukprot:11406531-Prorocentrum_lima.AAC.1
MDLALIGSYCCCFWLASKIVGHGDAGRIISKTVSIVTAAATMAIAGSAIAGGATNVGAAASLVDQAFKTTVIVASSCCLIMGIAFTVCFFYLSNKIDAAYTKALVLDTSGQVYDVAAIESAAMR